MSFQNKGLWMGKTTECLTDSEISYDSSSKMEPKRPHQWFMDNSDIELFPNKKQAVEVPNNNLFAAISTSNVSLWGNASGFNTMPAQFAERLFDSDSVRTVNFDARNMGSVGTGDMNMGRKVVEDPFANESMFGLSMSHSLEDPRSGFNYGGIRKVKVSQVKDSENVMSMSTGHTFTMENDDMSVGHAYNKAESNSISMGLAYSKGDDNFISTGRTYDREGNSFISMGQPYNKGDGNVDNVSIGSPYKGNDNALLTSNLFSKDDNRIISMGQSYNKEDENAMSTRQSYIDGGNNIVTMRHTYDKGDENILSMSHIYNKGDGSTISMCSPYNKDENNTLSMGHLYNKGDSHIISFGGYDDDTNPPGRLICSYDLLMRQPSIQRSDALNEKELAKSNVESRANSAQMPHPGNESTLKRKEEQKLKKEPPNSFPSNVRSLLSTGMLDGVSVKYIAWSREELRGVIKGSGYLCGCQSCNFFKVINAYEFERHADCKTKHPNNHIYFENGKTVYGIVQELRSTPQNMLFDVIQTITGSPINQKSFRLWKESFLAATRELQRIYGTS